MCCIRKLLFLFGLFYFNAGIAQENLTVYFQPKLTINYEVADNYKHNFSVGQRNYIFEDEASTFRTRQIDIVHFSNLKVKENQSIALGIQYRFRENFEFEKENELRLTQQYNFTSKPRNLRYGHRFRAQQRITSKLTIHRFGYRFALDFPLNGEKLDIGEAYLIFSTESLLSLAKSQGPEYDQRLNGNFGWLVKEKTKLQLGLEYRAENYTHKNENILFLNANLILNL